MTRTRPLLGLLAAAVVAAGLPVLSATATTAAEPATPVVFSASESVRPGEVLALQGSGFSATSQVVLETVSATTSALRQDNTSGALTTGGLRVVNRSSSVLHAIVPPDTAHALYAVTVDGGRPTYVNRARVWGIEFPEVAAGSALRLWGRNLQLPGFTPTARFVRRDTGTSLTAQVDLARSDAYALAVVAPSGIVPGAEYDVLVSNGAGGSTGEVAAERTVRGRTGGDPFALGTPWGGSFTEIATRRIDVATHGALPDDGVDDRAGVQAALDAAAAAGGGTVVFPSGVFALAGDPLQVPSRVVLQGAGRAATTLQFTGSGLALAIPADAHRIGLADLRLESSKAGISTASSTQLRELFVVRSDLVALTGSGLLWQSPGSHVPGDYKPCSMQHQHCAQMLAVHDSSLVMKSVGVCCAFSNGNWRWASIIGNRIEYPDHRTYLTDNQDLVFERNTVVLGRNASNNSTASYGGLWMESTSQSQVLDNTIEQPEDYAYNNDGEMIALENYLSVAKTIKGTVSSATATTVRDANYSLVGLTPDSYDGWTLAVVTGPAAGQFRRIVDHSGDTFTLDAPFDLVPGAGAHYVVRAIGSDVTVKGNTLTGGKRGIWIWDNSTRDWAVVGNTLIDAEGIQVRADERGTLIHPQGFKQWVDTNEGMLVADNVVRRVNRNRAAYVHVRAEDLLYPESDPLWGGMLFRTEVRRNVVDATFPNVSQMGDDPKGSNVDGYWAYAPWLGTDSPTDDGVTRAIDGMVFDGNSGRDLENGYTVGTGTYSTTIWNSTGTGIRRLLRDDSSSAGHGSVGTVGPDGTRLDGGGPTPTPSGSPTASPSGSPTPTPTSSPPSATSYRASTTYDATLRAERAFDGDRTTHWQSAAGDAARWIEVERPATSSFDRVTITSYLSEGLVAHRISSGVVEVEGPGGTLVEVARFSGNTAQDLVLDLPAAVTTDRVRLTVTGYTVGGAPWEPTGSITVAELATSLRP